MTRQTLLLKPRKDGSSLYEHMQQLASQTGHWPEEYRPLDPPERFRFVWDIFWEMRNHSKSGFSGPENLSFLEIDAWQRVRKLELGTLLVDMILAMDGAYMNEWHKKGKKNGS